jgi:hypothetical protein
MPTYQFAVDWEVDECACCPCATDEHDEKGEWLRSRCNFDGEVHSPHWHPIDCPLVKVKDGE